MIDSVGRKVSTIGCLKWRPIWFPNNFEPRMSLEGQKHELPRRSIAVRFAPNKQTPTGRAQCDAMCQSRHFALQEKQRPFLGVRPP